MQETITALAERKFGPVERVAQHPLYFSLRSNCPVLGKDLFDFRNGIEKAFPVRVRVQRIEWITVDGQDLIDGMIMIFETIQPRPGKIKL